MRSSVFIVRGHGDGRSGRGVLEVAASALVAAALVVTTGAAAPSPAAAYAPGIHATMASEALGLYTASLGPGANPEIADYWANIEDGARGEDETTDHIYELGTGISLPLIPGDVMPYLAHFWDSDSGSDDRYDDPTLGNYPNAWQKARRLWAIALGEYGAGHTANAYHYLGHVAHLVGDMAVPAHAHDDEHFVTGDDSYEDWMEDHGALDSGDRSVIAAGPIEIPVDQPDKLYWLMHTTNQVADFFASDDRDGDAVDPAGWSQAELDALATVVTSPRTKAQLANNDDGDVNSDGDLGRIRYYAYLRGIRAIAGLYGLFAESAGYRTTASVVINRVAEDNWLSHDTFNDPDYYAAVYVDSGGVGISGMASQNRGNYISNDDIITPNWTFSTEVDPARTQPLAVRIMIFDEDDGVLGGADDLSDITNKSGRELDLAVDVAKCLAGEPGAVAGAGDDAGIGFLQNGDGRCGVYTLLATGTSSPASRLSFTIGMASPRHPSASIKALPVWQASTSVPVRVGATTAVIVSTTYDVRYRRAKWSGGFGSPVVWRSAMAASSATFPASAGYTYCFSARVRDADRGVSPWTGETCTAVPLDDRGLTRVGRWTAGTGSAYYRSTYLKSSTAGAKLTRTGVVATRIALVATTCPTCGKVKVYWGSTLLKTVSLVSTRTVNKKLIPVATFAAARSGTLRIVVASGGRKVIIDGVAIRRN